MCATSRASTRRLATVWGLVGVVRLVRECSAVYSRAAWRGRVCHPVFRLVALSLSLASKFCCSASGPLVAVRTTPTNDGSAAPFGPDGAACVEGGASG